MSHPTNNADDESPPHEKKSENDPPTEPSGERFHTEYDDDESLCTAISMAVAAVSGTKLGEMAFLYECIDPDALEALMDEPVVNGDGSTVEVEFQYSGHWINIRNNGSITVLAAAEESR